MATNITILLWGCKWLQWALVECSFLHVITPSEQPLAVIITTCDLLYFAPSLLYHFEGVDYALCPHIGASLVGGFNLNGFNRSCSLLAVKGYIDFNLSEQSLDHHSMWFCCTLPSEWERLPAIFIVLKVTFIVSLYTVKLTILSVSIFLCSHSNTNCSDFIGFTVPVLWNPGWTRQPQLVCRSSIVMLA